MAEGARIEPCRICLLRRGSIRKGFERGGPAEFARFMAIAKGSAGEVEAQMYVALDEGYISTQEFQRIRELTASTKKLIAGFMKYLRGSKMPGLKLKR